MEKAKTWRTTTRKNRTHVDDQGQIWKGPVVSSTEKKRFPQIALNHYIQEEGSIKFNTVQTFSGINECKLRQTSFQLLLWDSLSYMAFRNTSRLIIYFIQRTIFAKTRLNIFRGNSIKKLGISFGIVRAINNMASSKFRGLTCSVFRELNLKNVQRSSCWTIWAAN